jgi:hypothetical protein
MAAKQEVIQLSENPESDLWQSTMARGLPRALSEGLGIDVVVQNIERSNSMRVHA